MRGTVGAEQKCGSTKGLHCIHASTWMHGSVLCIMLVHPGCSLIPRPSHPSICRLQY